MLTFALMRGEILNGMLASHRVMRAFETSPDTFIVSKNSLSHSPLCNGFCGSAVIYTGQYTSNFRCCGWSPKLQWLCFQLTSWPFLDRPESHENLDNLVSLV